MIRRFQYLTQDMAYRTHAELAEYACAGGAEWVQLRMKSGTNNKKLLVARQVKQICKKYKATFIINDDVHLALQAEADGVHLGKEDMPAGSARTLLGTHKIIGATANTFDDILAISKLDVDYIGLGPYRFTATKTALAPVIGSAGYISIMNKCKEYKIKTPVIAIGGINIDDVSILMGTGIHGIAVSSAINRSDAPVLTAGLFINEMNENYAAS